MGSPIHIHFRIHHCTTLLMGWLSMRGHMGAQLPVLLINCFHHALLYPMLGGIRSFRPFLPITGTLQLVVGAGTCILALFHRYLDFDEEPSSTTPLACGSELWAELACLSLYGIYLFLWINEMMEAFSSKPPVSALNTGAVAAASEGAITAKDNAASPTATTATTPSSTVSTPTDKKKLN